MIYTYTLENERKAGYEISQEEFAELAALEENNFIFQGAVDLPDGVEFARGFDRERNMITVYREPRRD